MGCKATSKQKEQDLRFGGLRSKLKRRSSTKGLVSALQTWSESIRDLRSRCSRAERPSQTWVLVGC